MKFRWAVMALSMLISLFLLLNPPKDHPREFTNLAQSLKSNLKLGLDLRGGIFMQLEVDVDDAVSQYLEEQAGSIKSSLETEKMVIASSEAVPADDTVILRGVTSDKSEEDLVDFIKERYSNSWFVDKSGADISFKLTTNERDRVRDDAVRQTVYKIQNRIDELGVTEPVINRTVGSNRIVVELAGADDVERVHNIVKEPGKLEWRMVEVGTGIFPTEQAALANYGGNLPSGKRVFPFVGEDKQEQGFMVLGEVQLTSANIANVFETRDDRGFPAVGVNLNRVGGSIFENLTERNIGNNLAIVLDSKVISAPTIQAKLGTSFVITGSFDQREVSDMVVKIKSGSLPAEVRILEERVIGPTLGRDAIENGAFATGLGMLLVVIFMLVYYRLSGLFANIALLMNSVLILGCIAFLGAVVTLPGIAGFILIIGMAVDANVLIFERIREELRDGQTVRKAVDAGYNAAFVTILDANITTALAGLCLMLMGEGPVKGFAVMLIVGITCSVFTAVFCSRTIFLAYLNRNPQLRSLSIWPVWKGSYQPGTSK